MLYMLATLSDQIAPLNVFRYITFAPAAPS